MFKRLKEKLRGFSGRVAASVRERFRKWNEVPISRIENGRRELGFEELTPLEESRIRTGYWNPRW